MIDIDCVDNETILIVKRDAGDVIVLVAWVLVKENLPDAVLAVGVFVDEIPIVVPVGFVLALVRELSMMTVPFIEELETIGLLKEEMLVIVAVGGRSVGELERETPLA